MLLMNNNVHYGLSTACCYMIAAVIQHNSIVITEPYNVADPEPSGSFRQLSDCSRGLSTVIG